MNEEHKVNLRIAMKYSGEILPEDLAAYCLYLCLQDNKPSWEIIKIAEYPFLEKSLFRFKSFNSKSSFFVLAIYKTFFQELIICCYPLITTANIWSSNNKPRQDKNTENTPRYSHGPFQTLFKILMVGLEGKKLEYSGVWDPCRPCLGSRRSSQIRPVQWRETRTIFFPGFLFFSISRNVSVCLKFNFLF